MARLLHVTLAQAGVLVASLLAAPSATAAPVSGGELQAWVVHEQRAFAAATADVALAVELRVAGTGEMGQASVTVSGTVNADGTMAVDLDSPLVAMTIVCPKPTRCWAKVTKGGSDRQWHRVPAPEVASLRDPLPIRDNDFPGDVAYSIDGAVGRADLSIDDVEVHALVSFANGARRDAVRLSDASEGTELTVTKALVPTTPVATPTPRHTGVPLAVDLMPQLP